MGRKPGPPVLFDEPESIYKWCRFTVRGKQYRLSTGETDPGRAQEKAEDLCAEIRLGRRPERPAAPRRAAGNLEDLVVKYIAWLHSINKSSRYIDSQQKHFRAQFLRRWSSLDDITEPAIAAWQSERARAPAMRIHPSGELRPLDHTVSSSTRYREEVTLRRFLHWAVHTAKIIEQAPRFEPTLAISSFVAPSITRIDIERLLAALPDRKTHRKRRPVREFYTVKWALALRLSELQALAWDWINWNKQPRCPHGTVTLPAIYNKNRKPWTLPLPRQAAQVLRELHDERSPVVPTARVFGRVQYDACLRNTAKRIGLGHVWQHLLRHARLTEVGHSTRHVAALQHFGRHKTLAMSQRYMHTSLESAADAIAAAEAAAQKARRILTERSAKSQDAPSSPQAAGGRKK
jgi:site-specific recombinase XerC